MLIPDSSSSCRSAAWNRPFRNFLLLGIVLTIGLVLPPDAAANDERRLRIAFEITSNSAFEAFVANVEGLQKNFGELAEITVVATSRGVELFRSEGNAYQGRLAKLADQGVDFIACSQGMEEVEMKPADLLAFARTVRSGYQQLDQLKKQGWAWVADGESYVSHL